MIVNVNPFDTGFDENTHVMKFSALAREVSTTVGGPTKGKQPTGTMVKLANMASRLMNRQTKRTVSIVTKPEVETEEPKQALWEVVEGQLRAKVAVIVLIPYHSGRGRARGARRRSCG